MASLSLKTIKNKLIKERDNILLLVRKDIDQQINNDVGDEIDLASQTLQKEIMYELTDTEQQMLENIENAIEKINQNQYGSCELCRKKISRERLSAVPSARYCVICQKKIEQSTQRE